MAFAYAVSLGELAYSVNEGSAILVTVSDELNIVIPATATSLAKYIDICTEKIEGATIEIREPQSQSSSLLPNHSHILTIWMSKSPDITFRVNAYSHAADSINLAFTSLEAAAMVQHSVLGKRSRTFRDTQTIQLSQAQPIDVSKYPHETDGAAVLYTATNSARALSNVLENTAIGANMPSEQHPIVSVAHLSLPKANPECQLNHDNYLQEQCSIPLRQEMLVPLYETFVDDDTIPLPPCQFAKPNVSTPTTEYDVPSTPENGISRAPIPAFGSLVDGDRCSLSKDCVEDRISAKGLPVEQDEDNESLRPSAHNVPAKQANQPNQRLHKSLELQALETNALEPESAAGDHGEQSCHKLIDPVRRNIGEEVIGPSLISDWGAPKADDKKVETPKSSLKRKASFADQCGTGSRKISRFQSMVNPAKGSGKVSTDGQDGAQFDFPTSAHKPRLLTTAYLPTSTRALNAPNSSKPVTNPKTRPVASSKPKIPADLVGHPAQSHEQKPPKEIAHPVTALSSKTIGIDAKVGGPGQTDRNSGLMIDSAKKHSEGKKPSKRNLKPKTKHVKVIGDLAYSTHKVQHAPNQMSKKKSKAVPKPPVQSRTTRAAALAANEKIQNLVEHETSEERDQVEIPPEFKESRAGLDADSRMTTTNLSIGAIEDSRPLPNDSRKHEGQPMENDQTVPMKTVLPNEVSRTEKGLRTKNHKDADVLASESAHLIEGQLVHDTTDMPQRRGTASATKDSQDSSLDHVQSDLLNAQPIVPPRQANGTRRVLSDDDQPRLVTPGVFRQNTSLQSNEELPLADDDSAVIPETPALGDIDAPDGAGGGFFEEATTFSHEGTTAFLDNPVDEEIPEAFLPDDQHEIDHGYREVKDLKTSHALKAAKPSTIVATTTPKVSIAAKLQSALSSVENRYVQAVSQGISNKLLPFKAAPPSKDNGPGLNQSDQENTLPLEPNKDIVSKIQAIESASVQTGKGMINDKAVNHIHTNLPDLGITFDSSEPAPIVENGERKDSNIINETPPEPARTLLDTTRADQVVQKQGLENVEKDPEGVVLSALSRKSHLHSLPGNSTPDTNEIRKVDKAAKSKSQTTSFNGAKSAVALVGPPLDINRKSNIIGFDSRGPRNQGTLSSQKPQSTEVPENQTPLPRRTRKQILKRKLQGLDLDTLDLKHVVTTKRQRVSEDVPQKLEKFHEIAMRRESPARKESGRKTGSQSTRVHPNGSPMPFLHARTNALQGPPRHVSIDTTRLADGKQEIDDEDDFFMSGSRLEDLDTGSPSIQANPSPSAASVRFISSSSSKHRLTSPNASSGVINGYTAHQVYSRGKFVDIQTENVVMAMRPTDPFLEVEQDSSNSFINRLRRLSDNPREQNSFLRGPVRSEDPDKTLIETSSAHKKDHLRAASNLSTTSDFDSSQSKDSFPSEEASNSERCDDEDEWVKALQPHQGKLLDVLCEISQVSQPSFSHQLHSSTQTSNHSV